ncbi:hypothetical protein BpHYR1_049841 [Brachionus plicatilis]|uniref:Uncharacterized protein n=1 Tax=Brachionus plicatilis TaxID=10195 RepID=A0A3M7P543_BRAPC|nr:hypothetical protein BpHYR1_049841 [Brachionus plicatilis]
MRHTILFSSRLRLAKSLRVACSRSNSSSHAWNTPKQAFIIFSKSSKLMIMSRCVDSTLRIWVVRSLEMASISLSARFIGYLVFRIRLM